MPYLDSTPPGTGPEGVIMQLPASGRACVYRPRLGRKSAVISPGMAMRATMRIKGDGSGPRGSIA